MKKLLFIGLLLLIFLAGAGAMYYFLGISQKVFTQDVPRASNGTMATNSLMVSPQKRAKNIILLIGDGMGLAQVSAAMAVNDHHLQLERCTHTGLSKTAAANKYITDSAAAGTAMACGIKTNNGVIAMTPDEEPVESILEIAEKKGLGTGLIATSKITHATPASFIAHENRRSSYEAIALDFLQTEVDVVIGGGLMHFNDREDERDLTRELTDKGYTIYDSFEQVRTTEATLFYGLCAEDDMPTMQQGRGDFLPTSVEIAMEKLSRHEKGFFLMAEGSQIDWGGHDRNADYVITEMLDFDEAIGKVLDFAVADSETLVIITADHETGGLSLTEYNDSTGELGMHFSSWHHTPIMVPVYAYGPGAELFTGIYENTEIFHKMLAAFDFPERATSP